jgi:hypothetical protein
VNNRPPFEYINKTDRKIIRNALWKANQLTAKKTYLIIIAIVALPGMNIYMIASASADKNTPAYILPIIIIIFLIGVTAIIIGLVTALNALIIHLKARLLDGIEFKTRITDKSITFSNQKSKKERSFPLENLKIIYDDHELLLLRSTFHVIILSKKNLQSVNALEYILDQVRR